MESAVSNGESTGDLRHFTLSELMYQVGAVVRREFEQKYWFTCDIDDLKRNPTGHVYMTLGHKNEGGQKSSVKAMIWNNDTGLIQRFEKQTGISFTKNITVLFLGQVTFSPQYGLSVKILDINPTFSIGQHELKLRRIREELYSKGYSQLNRSLPQPSDFNCVAVIAPTNASGLHDFKSKADLLERHGLCHFDYFHAMFQGERRIDTLSAAFAELVRNEVDYDCVCIIRGGGDAAGLSELAEWKLALMVCRSPYPVFTGIGHENDEIFLDEYANLSFSTPSMVANHIYSSIVNNAMNARSNFDYLSKTVRMMLENQKRDCDNLKTNVFNRMHLATSTWRSEIDKQSDRVFNLSNQSISDSRFSVTHEFNRLMTGSKNVVNSQRLTASNYHDSIRMGAYKAVQEAKSEVLNVKVDIDRKSRFCVDFAKNEVVRNFNALQLSSTRLISDQKSQVRQAMLELYSNGYGQVNIAKQSVSYELNNLVSSTKRQTQTAKIENDVAWDNTHKFANNVLERAKDKVLIGFQVINAYDPQKTLDRGYSIVYSNGDVVKEAGALSPGQKINVRTKDGAFDAKVD